MKGKSVGLALLLLLTAALAAGFVHSPRPAGAA